MYLDQKGVAMPTVLMVMLVISLLSAALWQYSITDTTDVARDEKRMQAYYIARSGAEALAQYIIDPSNPQEVKENLDKKTSNPQVLGNGTFTVSVKKSEVTNPKDPDFESLTITSIGTVADVSVPVRIKLKPTYTSVFVAVGDNGSIWRSPDGAAWTNVSPSSGSRDLNSVVWNGSCFVAVGDHGVFRTSTNGYDWSDEYTVSGINSNLNDVIWNGSLFVAVGDNSTILTSPSGLSGTWADVSAPPATGNRKLQAVAWDGSQFVVVGDGGVVRTSPNGYAWTDQEKAVDSVNENLNEIIWTGSDFIAVGDNRTVLALESGIWRDYIQETGSDINNLIWGWGVNRFVALGDDGDVRISTNGRIWGNEYNTGVSEDLYDIIWTGTRFVVVGDSATIIYSPTGMSGSWTEVILDSEKYNALNALALGSLDVAYSWQNVEWLK